MLNNSAVFDNHRLIIECRHFCQIQIEADFQTELFKLLTLKLFNYSVSLPNHGLYDSYCIWSSTCDLTCIKWQNTRLPLRVSFEIQAKEAIRQNPSQNALLVEFWTDPCRLKISFCYMWVLDLFRSSFDRPENKEFGTWRDVLNRTLNLLLNSKCSLQLFLLHWSESAHSFSVLNKFQNFS